MSNPNIFVSCIKVKGINLLPPVISLKRRAELERDRKQAIKLEKRLQSCNELKKNLEDLLNLRNITDRPQSAVTFGDNSHIEDLGISSARSNIQIKKKVNLSKDIIDVSEYNNDGIKIIDKYFSTVIESSQGHLYNGSHAYDTDASSYKTDISSSKTCEIGSTSLASRSTSSKDSFIEHCPALDLSIFDGNSEKQTPICRNSPKARLIRSNSYTLEAPSPILLEHLQKCSKTVIPDTEQIEPVLSRTWTSLENNYIPFEQSEFSSLNTVYNFAEKSEEYNEESMNSIQPEKDLNKETSPTIEVIQTDISVQQITVNANNDQVEPIKKTFDLKDPDCQLMQVLKKIPEDYSKQIIELIEKQRLEHSAKVENFGKKFSDSTNNVLSSTPIHEDNNSCISAISASPSQSIYYSFCSSDTVVPSSPSIKITDLEICEEEGVSSLNGIDKDVFEHDANYIRPSESDRSLFKSNYRDINDIKKEWAACVIGAHAKGYLTRRLLKTERVQSLIDTIRDALMCALQLHTIENIDEADIELHRRLINQVSAACYAFHDIFFALSTKDKMAVISADRKRRIEKARRPKSAADSKRSESNSSRSSTRSLSSLTQSLTNI